MDGQSNNNSKTTHPPTGRSQRHMIKVRFPLPEREDLEASARAAGVSLSEWIRMAVREKRIREEGEKEEN